MLDPQLLLEFPVFSGFPEHFFSKAAQWGNVLEIGSNKAIFQEGDSAENLYAVVDGEVELSFNVTDKILTADICYEEALQTHIETIDKKIVVESLGPGEIFGWSALTETGMFTSSATSTEPSQIVSLPAEELKNFFEETPQTGYLFMQRLTEVIAGRLRSRTEKLLESWSEAFEVNRM